MPTFVNGGSSGKSLSRGRSAMNCLPVMLRWRLQTVHWDRIFLMAVCAFGIQYFSRNFDNMWLRPLWPKSTWMDLKIRCATWWSFAKIAGCLDSSGIADLLSLPPTLRILSCKMVTTCRESYCVLQFYIAGGLWFPRETWLFGCSEWSLSQHFQCHLQSMYHLSLKLWSFSFPFQVQNSLIYCVLECGTTLSFFSSVSSECF